MTAQPDHIAPTVDVAAVARFCEIVFGYTEGFVPTRILAETGMPGAAPIAAYPRADGDLPDALARLARQAAQTSRAFYVVPATVAAPGSAKDGEIAETAVLLVDIDEGDIEAKRAHLLKHVGRPTLTVESGGTTPDGQRKLHLYWRLTEAASGADLALATRLRGGLAARGGADDCFKSVTQPIRVPGSLYFKNGASSAARIVGDSGTEYELSDLAERIHDIPPFAEIDAPPASCLVEPPKPSAADLMRRTIRENGVDGVTRYDAVSIVAGRLVFEARTGNRSVETAWERLQAYNATGLQPPWPEDRLRRSFDRLLARDRRTHAVAWNAGSDDATNADLPPTSDDALAIAFVEEHGEDWIVIPTLGQWQRWTGKRWEDDATSGHREAIRLVCRSRAQLEKPAEARRIASSRTILAVERILESDPELTLAPEALDADVMEFNCIGGIVDLQTGRLQEHCRSALMTNLSPAKPKPGCPRWLGFLEEVTGGNAELAGYLQRFCGYCLTGSTKEQVFLFLHGEGGNGKSVFLQTIAAILGDYAATASAETFLSTGVDRTASEMAQFRGVRLVIVTETELGRSWAENRIKAITGGEAVRARLLYANSFEYVPTFKLIVAGNHRPSFSDVGEAMRRRLHLVPFRTTIPEERRDQDLPDKLLEEQDGILAWMLDGLAAWRVRGLDPPQDVLTASRDYFADEDQIGEWLTTQCEVGAGHRIATTALFESWKRFAEASNLPSGSSKSFASALKARRFVAGRTGRERYWIGLRLRGGGEAP